MIELKKLKVLKGLSQETWCFTANVYIDGVKAGDVSNEGHGGSNRYHPYALEQQLTAIASKIAPRHDKVLDMTWQPDADTLIDDAMSFGLSMKDYLRDKKKYVLFVKEDDALYRIKMQPVFAEMIRRNDRTGLEAVLKTTVILNLLSDADAVNLLLCQE